MSNHLTFARSLPTVAILFLAVLNISCSQDGDNNSHEKLSVEGDGQTFPLTVTDQLGRKIKIEKKPQRIVSLAPSNTETLFAIGAGEKVVGVTAYCNYPPEAKKVQQVGGFAGHEISVERIVALQPDVVFTTGKYHTQLIEQLAQLDIPAIALEPTSFDEIYKTIELIGHATGHAKDGSGVVRSMQERVQAVENSIDRDETRPTVLYVVQAQPLMTVGKQSFISELIRRAGGRNLFDDVDADYPTVNQEAVISRDPEIIVLPSHGEEYGDIDQLTKRDGWEILRAVKSNRMHAVDGDLMVRTSPRIVDGLEQLAAKMFPERFAKEPSGSTRSEAEVESE